MKNHKNIQEDVPVTTTANGGDPLISPERPIKQGSMFRRFQQMRHERKETLNKKQ